MRLSLSFGADNCVRVKRYTEPKSRNIGDNPEIKHSERNGKLDNELEVQLRLLRRMDSMSVDKLELLDSSTDELSIVTRADVLTEVDRFVKLRYGVKEFLSTIQNNVIPQNMSGVQGSFSESMDRLFIDKNVLSVTDLIPPVVEGTGCPVGLSPTLSFKRVAVALDLLNESRRAANKSKVKKKFSYDHKPTTFGAAAKLAVREAGAICDRDYKGKVYLLTLTLPSDGHEQFKLLARHSGYVIDRIQRLFRNIPGLQYYYVWEFQKRGALHIHYAIAHKWHWIAEKCCNMAKNQFYKILRDLSKEHDLDMFASKSSPSGTWKKSPEKWQWSIDKINKSVVGYLSKYLSKGNLGLTKSFYPARWWGCCSSLREKVKEARVSITLPELDNDVAIHGYDRLIDFFLELNPKFALPYENHIHNTVLTQDPDGHDVRVPVQSLLMSIFGCNFYFKSDEWLELYKVLREYFLNDFNSFLYKMQLDFNAGVLNPDRSDRLFERCTIGNLFSADLAFVEL